LFEVKTSDWLRSGTLLLPKFILQVLASSLALAVVPALFAIPTLWSSGAAHVSLVFKLTLLTKILLFAFCGAFFPFLVARVGAQFLFPKLESSAQFIATIIIFLATSSLNLLTTISENPALVSDWNHLGFLVNGGGSAYRSLSMFIWLVVFGIAAVRKIREPFSASLRISRMISVLGIIAAVLFVDWQISLHFRKVDTANRAPNITHELAIMVPVLTRADVEKILQDPLLDEWKASLRFISEVAPSTESDLGQSVSILTGLQPWQHGIRKDFVNEDEQRMLSSYLAETLTPERNSLLEVRTLGSVSPVADVLGGSMVRRCSLQPETALSVRASEKMLLAHAQIPERIVGILFPESRCTQKLSSLSMIASQELLDYGTLFRKPNKVRSLWWVDPATGAGEAPEILLERRLTSLKNTFIAIDAHLGLLDLRKNTRITIIGLGKRTYGTMAIISEEASLPFLPEGATTGKLLITSAQAASLFNSQSIPVESLAYTESPRWEHIPPTDAEVSRSTFYAKRSILCSWKANGNTNSAQFVLHPGDSEIKAFTESQRAESSTTVLSNTVKESREECENLAHAAFRSILSSDISLANRPPILALYDHFITAKQWAPPPSETPQAVEVQRQ